MKYLKTKSRFGVGFLSVLLVVGMLMAVLPGTAAAKAIFVCSEHHNRQFDAWNINPDGTINKLGTYGLTYASDPAGIAIDTVDPHTGTIIFITSEFSSGIEIVEVPPVGTPTSLGCSSGPSNLSGIDIDDVDNIVYTLRRQTNDLYIYSWDPVAETLTQLAMIDLPGLSYGYGLALDDSSDILWVSDTPNKMVRAYDVSDLSAIVEIPTSSFPVSHPPVDVALDSFRNVVYTVGGWHGSRLLSKYDVATGKETTVNLGHNGCGVAVDETNGYVYISGGPSEAQNLSVWDCSTTPFNEIQDVGDIGRPAGLAIASFIVNRLNLAKNDVVVGRGIYIGQTFTYEITCDNTLNPDLDATGVTILDFLPLELDFVSATHGGIYDLATHAVLWDIGIIPAGGTGPLIELVVKVNQNAIGGSTIYNYCTIEGNQIPPTTVIGEDPDAPPGEEPGSYIIPNQPPVADAGADQDNVEQDSHAGASIALDGSVSSDPDDDPLTYSWTWDGEFAIGVNPTVVLPLGTTTVTLVVNDGTVDSNPDTVDITVVDTTPPKINIVSASPDVLWPPNHKMVEVMVTVDCGDICDPAPFCYILGVTSNEPINGPGDGNTEPDWELFDDEPLVVLLRAERAGVGTDRIYTIHIECMDASSNIASEIAEVIVPHDQGKGKK